MGPQTGFCFIFRVMASSSEGTVFWQKRAAVLPALTPPPSMSSAETGSLPEFSRRSEQQLLSPESLLTCLKSPSLTEEVWGFVTAEGA